MKCAGYVLGMAVAAISMPVAGQDAAVFTLYRNSVVDGTMRIHVATFDTGNGADYNEENCAVAADLFQRQGGVDTRFWCEPGYFTD